MSQRTIDDRILPEGDRGGGRRGRGQFRLMSLVWLLAAGAVVLSAAKILHCDLGTNALLLVLTVAAWWHLAELRNPPAPTIDQSPEALREEIRRWKNGQKQAGESPGPRSSASPGRPETEAQGP